MSRSRSRTRGALGAGLLAAAATATFAAPASASVMPKPFDLTTPLPFVCGLPGSLVEVPSQPGASVTMTSWIDYVGTTFPNGASGYATIPGLQEALVRAGATTATVSGRVGWHVEPFEAPAVDSVADFEAPLGPIEDLGADTSGNEARVPFKVGPPAGTPRVGPNPVFIDALTYVFRGTTAQGQPVDFGSVRDGDGDPNTLTFACEGARTRVGIVNRAVTPPLPPPSLSLERATPTSLTVRVSVVQGTIADVVRLSNGQTQPIGGDGTVTFEGLTPNTPYTVSVRSTNVDGIGNESSRTYTTTALPATAPVSLNGSSKFTVNGSLNGSTASWALVRGELDATSGAFSGTTTIDPATGNTTALGLFGIRATFAFTEAGPTTGTSSAGSFSLTTQQDVALKKATFLGISIATGTCHTATAPTITLKSTTEGATLLKGGAATGTFQLGRLTGCSTFGSLFGTNGGRATLQVQFAPFPVQPPVPPTT